MTLYTIRENVFFSFLGELDKTDRIQSFLAFFTLFVGDWTIISINFNLEKCACIVLCSMSAILYACVTEFWSHSSYFFPPRFFFFFIHFHKLTRRKDNKLRNFKYRTSNLMPSIYSCGREKKNIFQPLSLLFFFFSPLFYAGLEIGRRDNESGCGFSDIDFS